MKLTEIPIGALMQIEVRQLIEGEAFITVKARVLDFDGDDIVIFEQPSFKGLPVPFIEGDWLRIFFSLNEKHYAMEVTFLEFARLDSMRGIKLKLNTKVEEIQRRNYYRLKSSVDVKIALISRDGFVSGGRVLYSESTAYDISGGGMRLIVNDTYQKGDRVECVVGVAENEIKVQGDIVWRNMPESIPANKCEVGVKFDFVTETSREEVIKFIFEEQRRVLRKEGKMGSLSK